MAELIVEIPDGLSEEHKRDLQAWLTHLAHAVIAELNAEAGLSMNDAIDRVSLKHGLTR